MKTGSLVHNKMKQFLQAIACALIAILAAPAANAMVYDQAEEAVLVGCRALNTHILDYNKIRPYNPETGEGTRINLPDAQIHDVVPDDTFNEVCFSGWGDKVAGGENALAQSLPAQGNYQGQEVLGQSSDVSVPYSGSTWLSPQRDAMPSPDKYKLDGHLPMVDSTLAWLVTAANSGRWAPVKFKAPTMLESIQENVTVNLKRAFKPTSDNIFYWAVILIMIFAAVLPFGLKWFTQRPPRWRKGQYTRSFKEVTYGTSDNIGLSLRDRSKPDDDIRLTDRLEKITVPQENDKIDLLELFSSSERSAIKSFETEGGFEIVTLKR